MRILCCCLVLFSFLFGEDVLAQRADSPSHRLIPRKRGGLAPKFDDFKSEELKELLDEYGKARREQIKRRRESQTPPQQSQSGESLPSAAQSMQPRLREFVERLDQTAKDSASKDMQEEIAKVNDEMASRLDGPLSNTLKPDSIPLDTKRNVIKDFGDMIRQQQKEARNQYQQAMEAYKRVWPSDGIPPDEWLKKVQPYINPELVRQMREFRDTKKRDLTNTKSNDSAFQHEAGKSLPSSIADDAQKKKSKGIFDSLISAMDKKGTRWLKSSKKENSKDKKRSWWTALKSRSKDRMSSINKKVTQHSRNVNRQKAVTTPPTTTSVSGNGGSTTNGRGKLILSVFGFATIVGLGYYFYRNYFTVPASSEIAAAHVRADSIRDRESLLHACNMLAWRCFGWPSRFWSHRTVFAKLSEQMSEESAARQLSGLYEHARYAPDGHLSSQEIELAQRLFEKIRSQSLVTQ